MTEKISLNEYKTVSNAIITLGDTDDSGKGRHFKSRFIQPGLAGYPGQFGNALIKKENLDKFIHTLRNKPVTINHKDNIGDDDKVGEVLNVWYNPDDGWYWCDGIITDETAQNLIQDKKWSVSCSYDFTKYDDEGGTENNIPYDIEFLDGEFNHLAIVDNPRYEGANIVFNSKAYNPEQPRDEQGRWTKEDYNAEIDKVVAGQYPRGKQIRVKDKPSEVWLKAGLQEAEMMLPVGVYEKSTVDKHNVSEETMRNLPDLLDNPLYIFKSSTQPDSFVGVLDDFEEDNGIKKPLIAAVKPVDGQTEVNILTSIYGKDNDFTNRETLKGNLLYDKSQNNKTALNSIIASIAMETSKPSINIIDYVIQKFNPTTIDNAKEQEMALLDELKKLITKVENDKGENMDEKEKQVENEKTDKRKLIDEVGGILKGKVDDEIIRTIIGKMEKASYDKSEAGSADNKKVKNEIGDNTHGRKDSDDSPQNSKVKNEDEEPEKDKEKVKELEKDEKEDVENKCKNSVDNAKDGFFDKLNKIYNSTVEPTKQETEYVSRADRLKAGEEYFKV